MTTDATSSGIVAAALGGAAIGDASDRGTRAADARFRRAHVHLAGRRGRIAGWLVTIELVGLPSCSAGGCLVIAGYVAVRYDGRHD